VKIAGINNRRREWDQPLGLPRGMGFEKEEREKKEGEAKKGDVR
jgi:hypothetical protein